MKSPAYYIINAITVYRIIAAPLLLYLVFNNQPGPFKWLLGISFFTDAIDGFLARKFNVTSILGSRLDSIGDDLTVLVGTIGLFVLESTFIKAQWPWLLLPGGLFAIQMTYGLIKYKKPTSFHTLLAKIAAVFQGMFLILSFFLPEPPLVLFYVTLFITSLQLVEEIILVHRLRNWKANVRGLYWLNKIILAGFL